MAGGHVGEWKKVTGWNRAMAMAILSQPFFFGGRGGGGEGFVLRLYWTCPHRILGT